MNKKSIIARLKALKPYLRENYAVKQISLFGSYANRTDDFESDIDLLVVFEKNLAGSIFLFKFSLKASLKGK